MDDRALLQQALEALEFLYGWTPDTDPVVDDAINALRERLAQAGPIDSAEKASAYLDARLWEFIDMAAAWPEATPDPRTWGHVLVYAPKRQEPVKFNCTVVDDAHPEGVPLSQWGRQPVTLETVYETIVQWDEGGGRRSRRELARRIVALYANTGATP
jgi:hypothetical protein